MPIGGISTSLTSEVTMAPKAAPMMRPTAMSTTLPRMANSRNSFSMSGSSALRGHGWLGWQRRQIVGEAFVVQCTGPAFTKPGDSRRTVVAQFREDQPRHEGGPVESHRAMREDLVSFGNQPR